MTLNTRKRSEFASAWYFCGCWRFRQSRTTSLWKTLQTRPRNEFVSTSGLWFTEFCDSDSNIAVTIPRIDCNGSSDDSKLDLKPRDHRVTFRHRCIGAVDSELAGLWRMWTVKMKEEFTSAPPTCECSPLVSIWIVKGNHLYLAPLDDITRQTWRENDSSFVEFMYRRCNSRRRCLLTSLQECVVILFLSIS